MSKVPRLCLFRTTKTSPTCELRRTRRQRSSTVFLPQGRLSLFVPIRFDSPAANKIADILIIFPTQRKSVKLNRFSDLLSRSNFGELSFSDTVSGKNKETQWTHWIGVNSLNSSEEVEFHSRLVFQTSLLLRRPKSLQLIPPRTTASFWECRALVTLLLKNHFTLYQGYVTNTNRLIDTLSQMVKDGKTGTPEYAELKRRFGWEFNGMRLHEYYFENLGGKEEIDRSGKLFKRILEDFGSYENWETGF